MSIQFVLGNSGGGKTTFLYEKIIREAKEHPEKRYLVIVPEQFTMSTQKALVDMHPRHSILNIDILSFGRLSYRVLEELGGGDGLILEDTGKNFLLRKIAEEKKSELRVLKGNLRKMGYIDEIKSFLSELMQYRVDPQALLAMSELAQTDVLKNKLLDIHLIYKTFLDEIAKSYITAEGRMELVTSRVKDSQWLAGSTLVFDGFTGFTPIQNELLSELMKVSEKIYITATMERTVQPFTVGPMQELFYMSRKFLETTKEIARENHVPIEPEILWCTEGEKLQFPKAPALYHLEQNLFRAKNAPYKGSGEEITISRLSDPKEEAEYAARQIYLMVKNEGFRYRDFAVVSGDAQGYAPYMEQAFRRYGIPFFMDGVSKVVYHPFSECFLGIIEMIRTDLSYHSVIAFLRTGFYGLSAEEVDRLDNYLLACGIDRRYRWEKEWSSNPLRLDDAELASLNDFRERFLQDLEPVRESFLGQSIEAETRAIYDLLVQMDCGHKLAAQAKKLEEDGDFARAKQTEQIYRIVLQALERLIELLGQDSADATEYKELISAGFSATQVAIIPHGNDCVTIGDIERTRLNRIRVLFFVGVNDGIIPGAGGDGGILSELERSELLEKKAPLAYGARERALVQRFYLYLNMTKPSERLYVTYAGMSATGEARRPSFLISAMQKMFVNRTVTVSMRADGLPETPQAGFRRYSADLAAFVGNEKEVDPEEWLLLFSWYRANEAYRERAQRVFSAAFYPEFEESIGAERARLLYGNVLKNSVTRLETYNSCAFAHFLNYGLRLAERQVYEVNAADIGNVLHEAMDNYTKLVFESDLEFTEVPEDTRKVFCEDAMDHALKNAEKGFADTKRNKFLTYRVRKIFTRTVDTVTRQMQAGGFQPIGHEEKFNEKYQLSDKTTMELIGKIDRIDQAVTEDMRAVRIVDYKSSSKELDLTQFYYGVSLQLLLYLDSAVKKAMQKDPDQTVVPAGVMYYGMKNPFANLKEPIGKEKAEETIYDELKMKGYVNREQSLLILQDKELATGAKPSIYKTKKGNLEQLSTAQFEDLMEFAGKKVLVSGEEMLSGMVAINPMSGVNDSCAYCGYAAICGKDPRTATSGERYIEKMNQDEILDQIHRQLHPEEAMGEESNE